MACNYLEFNISSIDLADATGNSNIYPYIDGAVYGVYNDCSGNTLTIQYTNYGIFSATTCFDTLNLTSVIYYKNDAEYFATYSSFINTGEPCDTPPTPTPTATYIEYQITSFGYATSNEACASLNSTTTIYADPSYNVPMVGMIFYDDTALTIPYNGGFLSQYYLLEKNGTKWAAQVNTIGELTNYLSCTVTPSVTPTQTPSYTPTQTPTNTSTPTQTPSYTPTQTTTPSASGIICGYGITTGTYYYTDCCGDLIQGNVQNLTVSMDYTKPSSGVNKLNSFATQACLTPTPTQTQTYTPTNTITPTVTPSVTKTPTVTPSTTVTPSKSGVYRLKNNCDVFTLFDLGVSCNVISLPSSPTSNDGILSLNVTGGTSPYSFYWTNGQRTQTLAQIGQGVYECTVIDYYGDYSSTTVCSLFAPSATPTPSVTTTPTVTPSGTCPKLCFIAIGTNTSYGPWQFVCNGMFNGKTTWNYGDYNIVWKGARWEIVGSDMTTAFVADNGGIFASTTTSSIPLSSWSSVGGVYQYSVTMTEGDCSSTIPIQTKVSYQDSTCDGIKNCDGSITISAKYGTPPYYYSINNGLTYQTNGLFFGLCPNTYTVLTKDSKGGTNTDIVTLTYLQQPTTYQISINLLANKTLTSSGPNFISTTNYLTVTTIPAIPEGITLQFNLDFSSIKTINGPGSGTCINEIVVNQNQTLKSPFNTQTTTTLGTRPNCNPELQTQITDSASYSVELGSLSSVTITAQSQLTITDGQIGQQSNCVTELEEIIYVQATSPKVIGCTCCSVVADSNRTPAVSNSISYESNANPEPQQFYFTADVYDSGCLSIDSIIIGVNNSSEIIVGYYYPVSGLDGPIIRITGRTNDFPTYFVTINSIGYFSCGEISGNYLT